MTMNCLNRSEQDKELIVSKRDLSQEEANKVFDYLPDIGKLVWSVDIGTRARRGNIAGHLFKQKKRKTDYWRVKLNGVNYMAHRVIWTMKYGDIPEGIEIDHEDGNGLNNTIQNLRLVTHAQQHKNLPARDDNKSGHVGVFKLCNGKYLSYINSDKKRFNLGTYNDKKEAILIRKTAEKEHCSHENHGR